MKKNIQSVLICCLLLLLLGSILTFPREVIESVSFSISLWRDNLFPSLFPFLIISSFLSNYGVAYLFSEMTKPFMVQVLHLPASCGFTLIASMLAGFPSSSMFIKDQLDRKEITIEEANYLLSFCHFSSPLFVIGTIGTLLLGNPRLGFFILLAHYIGNFLLAFLFRPTIRHSSSTFCFPKTWQIIQKKISQSPPFATVLKNAIKSALDTLFLLLGIVTIFLVLTNLITNLLPLSLGQRTFLSSILEMTQGVKNVSFLSIPLFYKILWMEGIISFGGISVHTQICSILANYPISYWKFLKARILHVLFSCGILWLLLRCFLP